MARTIAITGKGGVGKTTVAALIVRYLEDSAAGPILALDADPDCNLGSVLGIDVEQTIGGLREELLKEMKDLPPGMSKQQYIEAGLHQIVVETPKLDLITMGRGEGPGCYCFVNILLRKFAEDLAPSYQWVVMDNEAGMEHISRRTTSQIDDLIVVVNANPLSHDCARRIDRLLDGLGREVRDRYFLLNATSPKLADAVREKLADLSLEYLGCLPRDEALEDLAFEGKSIFALQDGPALQGIWQAMDRIMGRTARPIRAEQVQ